MTCLTLYCFEISHSRVGWEEWNAIKTNPNSSLNETSKQNATETPENFDHQPSIQNREVYVIMYSCFTVFGTLCFLVHSFTFYQMCLRISVNLHDMMFRAISRAKMLFFNMNPSGRILNRFSRNVDSVDTALPQTMNNVIDVRI